MTNDSSNSSMHSVRNIFSRAAEAATAIPEAAAQQQAPVEVAGAAPQPSDASSTPAPGPTEASVGQTTVTSALEAATATPAPTVAPATTVPTRAPTLEPTEIPTEVETAAPVAATSSLQEALAASQWPPELWPTVERIVRCESSGNTAAYNPAGYVGLMQVSPSLHGPVPADAVGQLNQGYEVYLKQGWGAWGCY